MEIKINGFDSLKDWCEYTEIHYLPLLDKLTEQDSLITDKDDKWLLTLLFNDLTSIVNNRELLE